MYGDEAPASAALAPPVVVNNYVPPANGYEPPPPPRLMGPRIPRQALEEWLDLPEPYQGFRIRAWLGYQQRLFTSIPAVTAEDADEQRAQLETAKAQLRAALKQILLEHNGWQDDEGELPQPHDDAFYERCPANLFNTTLALVRQAAETPPNLPPRTRRR